MERECPTKENGGRAGSRHGDFERSCEGKPVSPERRRHTIAKVHRRLGLQKVSERRGCRVLDQPRSTLRYPSRRLGDEPRLLREMRVWVRRRPRFGAERIHRWLLAGTGHVNHKRVHCLSKRENMQVRRKQHRRRQFPGGSENSCVRRPSQHKDQFGRTSF